MNGWEGIHWFKENKYGRTNQGISLSLLERSNLRDVRETILLRIKTVLTYRNTLTLSLIVLLITEEFFKIFLVTILF